ncbi:hypothetical protein [Spirosoma sp. KUDC1026]|uniref:hypothetical protein n=1 Tax=Spirosoma sp. KUDC1026 TaxID=2745947 RepID=UPI00159BEFC5|nr:hypothetical protein [Spirosoma sp. KUDC1026]QKZ13027.1 hypothetical protein HU175_10440 [Spirosoma sp. KUDC1026]
MVKPIHPQYITDEQGNRVSLVLPIQQLLLLLEELDELEDIRLYNEVKGRNETTISLADYRQKHQ